MATELEARGVTALGDGWELHHDHEAGRWYLSVRSALTGKIATLRLSPDEFTDLRSGLAFAEMVTSARQFVGPPRVPLRLVYGLGEPPEPA